MRSVRAVLAALGWVVGVVALGLAMALFVTGCQSPNPAGWHVDVDGDGVPETWIRFTPDGLLEVVEPVPKAKE